jgi:glycogen operon protein
MNGGRSLRPDGRERGPEEWDDPEDRCLAYVLSGEAHGFHLTASGEPESDETFLAILNAQPKPVSFKLRPERFGKNWGRLLNTASEGPTHARTYKAGEACVVEGRSLVLLMRWDGSFPACKLEPW